MSGWAAKRFWAEVSTIPCDGGFTVRLDARAIKTPAKAALVVPTVGLAEAMAAEWRAQIGPVRPATMPLTRMANSAIDKVTPQFGAVADLVAAYGASDLLCYRAEGPDSLIARQAAGWDPWLDWVSDILRAPLTVTAGVIPVAQPIPSLARLSARVSALSPFALAALHDLVAISGSLVLGLAVIEQKLSAGAAFDLSRIDEHWQAELWGRDEDAADVEARKRAAMEEAERFLGLSGPVVA